MQRIFVAVDFSPESRKALHYAGSLAAHFGASLTLIHVLEPAFCPPQLGDGPTPCTMSEKERIAWSTTKLGIWGRRMLGPCRVVETVVRSGLAFFEITEAATALGADLIVVGTHGYTGLKRALLGSTAEKVVRHAPCPVLVIRGEQLEVAG